MRRTFVLWLLFFVLLAFLLTFGISFIIQTKLAENDAKVLVYSKLEECISELVSADIKYSAIKGMADEILISKAKSISDEIYYDNDLLTDSEALEKLKKYRSVLEITVTDDKGIVVSSTEKNTLGQDLHSDVSKEVLLKGIGTEDFAYACDPVAVEGEGERMLYQYAGALRSDSPGLVIVKSTTSTHLDSSNFKALGNFVNDYKIGTGGEIIICKDNIVVSIKDKNYLQKPLSDYGIDEKIIGTNGSTTEFLNGEKVMCFSAPYETYTFVGTYPKSEVYENRNALLQSMFLIFIIIFLMIFVMQQELVKKTVIDKLDVINASLDKITNGDLDTVVDVHTNKEFSSLSEGINKTVDSLKNEINKANKRNDRELGLAKSIQLSVIPSVFPPFPDKKEFDIYASMYAAREVGGDFYDFFTIENNRLVFMIADVSGKGIPAAMMMMNVRSLIKSYGESGLTIDKVFEKVNNTLYKNNESEMFVTAWLGVMDFNNSRLRYVNAGHCQPLYKKKDEKFEFFDYRYGCAMGVIPNKQYERIEYDLSYGDILFLYTDGVTDAENEQGEYFGEERLKEALNSIDDSDLIVFLEKLKQKISEFSAGVRQYDDIAMMILRINDPSED